MIIYNTYLSFVCLLLFSFGIFFLLLFVVQVIYQLVYKVIYFQPIHSIFCSVL